MSDTNNTALQNAPPQEAVEMGYWQLEGVPPIDILGRLPKMDRVMLAIRQEGVLHERLGKVLQVSHLDGMIVISGDGQDAHIPSAQFASVRFASVRLDISTQMRGKLYPKLEFADAAGKQVFSVTGLEGAAPILAALDDIARAPITAKEAVEKTGETPEDIAEDDPGMVLLDELRGNGKTVEIRAVNNGMRQSWHGKIEKIMPMGGYINVMTKTFHLHLSAGVVAHWDMIEGVHVAIGADGAPLGLEVRT